MGHARHEIAQTGDLSKETKTLLPLYVSGATTLGELLAHPVTVSAAGQLIQQMKSGMMGVMQGEDTAEALGTGAEMMEAMMMGMPLKSLASFAGPEAAAQIEQMMGSLNQMLGNQ